MEGEIELMHLDDHCLLLVLERLIDTSLRDMRAAHNTCVRIRRLVMQTMRVYYRNEKFSLNIERRSYTNRLHNFIKFCGVFSHLVLWIHSLERPEELQRIFQAIQESNPALVSLAIDFPLDLARNELHSFLANVRALKLHFYSSCLKAEEEDRIKDALMVFENLEELSVNLRNSRGTFLQQNFGKLKFLELRSVDSSSHLDNLKSFLELNPSVDNVSIEKYVSSLKFLNIFNYFQYLKNVKNFRLMYPSRFWYTLELRDLPRDLCKLEKLTHLSIDTIELDTVPFITKLAEKNNLLRLHLNVRAHVVVNDMLAEAFNNMTKLQELSLCILSRASENFFKILCGHLSNLSTFHLKCEDVMNMEYLNDIIVISKNLKNFQFNIYDIDQPLSEDRAIAIVNLRRDQDFVRPLNIQSKKAEHCFPCKIWKGHSNIITVTKHDSQYVFYKTLFHKN